MAEIKIGTQNPGDAKVSETRTTPQQGDYVAAAENPRDNSRNNPHATSRENPRKAIKEARAARLKVIEGPSKTVKVYPASDTIREIMKHANGTRFPSNGPAEWPIDGFTTRRIAEGSVSTEEGAGGAYGEVDETQNPREQAAANKPKPKKEEPPKEEPPKAEGKHARSASQPAA
jgi:hypothetical protein